MNEVLLGIVPSLHIRRRLLKWLAVVTVYSLFVVCVREYFDFRVWPEGAETGAALGLVLGVLVVFRNNAAYDRWWEARKLLGQLINDTRNLLLKAQAHVAVDPSEHTELGHALANFANALRLHLRGITGLHRVPGQEKEPYNHPHAPVHFAAQVQEILSRWNRQGKLKDTLWILDAHARGLMDVCGACERIRNTPLASSYRALVRLALLTYVLTAPWSLALDMGLWALPVLEVAFFFLLGIELTAEDIEEPFGIGADELPLEDYCQTIDTFVAEAIKTQA